LGPDATIVSKAGRSYPRASHRALNHGRDLAFTHPRTDRDKRLIRHRFEARGRITNDRDLEAVLDQTALLDEPLRRLQCDANRARRERTHQPLLTSDGQMLGLDASRRDADRDQRVDERLIVAATDAPHAECRTGGIRALQRFNCILIPEVDEQFDGIVCDDHGAGSPGVVRQIADVVRIGDDERVERLGSNRLAQRSMARGEDGGRGETHRLTAPAIRSSLRAPLDRWQAQQATPRARR
jgi:hypothetical protein